MSSAEKEPHYDLTKKQREIHEWKHARKMQLRELYMKEAYHPTKQGLVFDEQVFRFVTLRTLFEQRFKPNKESGFFALGVLAVFIIGWQHFRQSKLNNYRTSMAGVIPPSEKKYKFT